MARAYRVILIPSLLLFDGAGRLVARQAGLLDAAAIRAKVEGLTL
jgi:hypothetical protein